MRVVHRERSFVSLSVSTGFWAVALALVACGYEAKTVPMGMSGTPAGGSGNATATTGSSVTSGSASATAGSGSASAGFGGSGDVVGMSGTAAGTGATSGASGGSSGATASGMSSGSAVGMGGKNPNLTYTKVTVHTRFLAESLAVADFDHDGNLDIASGRNWYAGPNWAAPTSQHIYRDGHGDLPVAGDGIEINTGVSDSWSAFAYDVNGDGWDDIIQISASDMGPQEAYSAQNTVMAKSANPAGTGYWYQNPKNTGTGNWQKYLISSDMKGEHKAYADLTGDGKPEIVGSCKNCNPIETWGYWQAAADPTAQWTFHPVTRTYTYKDGCCGWLHGLGVGDVNGDGKLDLLERSGVWLQPAAITSPWTFLNVALSDNAGIMTLGIDPDIGGSHMYAYDVDGDGMADLVNSLQSHGYGLAWFKQGPANMFTRQLITSPTGDNATPCPGGCGPAFSQLHSLHLEDMDGDGLKDIITGKTFLAHPYATNDAGGHGQVVLYIFKLVRTPMVHFEPHLIDADMPGGVLGSGVGREFKVVDMNKDGILDIVIASKRGLYVYLGKP
jgi:hypothetical protein